jgi:ATP-dependent RNA helicase DDX31/DBP7
MVLPQELGWVDNVLEANMTIQATVGDDAVVESKNQGHAKKISPASIEVILQQGFGGATGTLEYQSRATGVQLAFERWVISGERPSLFARKAFLSHVRAYATHSADEKQYFNVRALHLGHLAKAFALREAPRSLGAKSASLATASTKFEAKTVSTGDKRARSDTDSDDDSDDEDGGSDYETRAKRNKTDGFELDKAALAKLTESIVANADGSNRSKKLAREAARAAAAAGVAGEKAKQTDAEARMYAKVRALGKMSKKHGVLGAHGADEFQIA